MNIHPYHGTHHTKAKRAPALIYYSKTSKRHPAKLNPSKFSSPPHKPPHIQQSHTAIGGISSHGGSAKKVQILGLAQPSGITRLATRWRGPHLTQLGRCLQGPLARVRSQLREARAARAAASGTQEKRCIVAARLHSVRSRDHPSSRILAWWPRSGGTWAPIASLRAPR